MNASTSTATHRKRTLVTSNILTVLVALFLTFDTVLKVFAMAPAIEATTALGYPATAVVPAMAAPYADDY